ncbi:hypothetical protein MYU51_015111 [Penicillium brevicompactum]|uniref:Concanavalin A-like lectin/glucanase n=1 Tax=Penicillium brevicompactum TaxID=5074 RepID=A0A9W9QBR4_PENBR|nr:uncharacterized protein N7506_001949 [Penicillium brevicompactum]KAJ5329398.1 hypothetical protein N7452_009788 [Penicillium brevicompactum]KAJ5348696.1 hypothetical protein N7506_001949 [Penicillium brevicompactum]
MRYSFALVPLANAIGALAAADSWVFGNTGFYLGPPSGSAEIVKATYSITPPAVPSGYTVSDSNDEVWVSVWVGASASAGSDDYNLYQPLFNWSPDQESQGCSASVDEWCVAASTFTPDGQLGQEYITVPKDTAVDFEIAVANNKVTQTVNMNGKEISKETDALDSPLKYIMSTDECYTGSGSCGTVNTWYVKNLTITLNKADTKFGETFTAGGLTSSDNGITWTADSVDVQKVNYADSADIS